MVFFIAKFGTDIELNAGQAPSVLGNYSLSMQVQFERPVTTQATGPLQLVVMCPSSGFFHSQGGCSRIVKNLLTESDVMNAPMSNTDENFQRFIGVGFFSKLGSSIGSVGKTIGKIVSNPDVQRAGIDVGKKILINQLEGKGYASRGVSAGSRNRKPKISSLL